MTHHAYDTVLDLAARLDREELWDRPFRLDVHPVADVVLDYTFIPGELVESVLYASDGDGNRVKEGNAWVIDYITEGWTDYRLCDNAEMLRGDLLRDMMDDAVDSAPEYVTMFAVVHGMVTESDAPIGWVILIKQTERE